MPKNSRRIAHQYKTLKGVRTLNLTFSVLTSPNDKADASALIRDSHYQGSVANRCEFVGCHVDVGQRSVLIGAAALGAMVYCRPRGRARLAVSLGIRDWQDLSRPELIRELGVICGLRFAIADEYQSAGIGGQLALAVRYLAHSDLERPYERVEVMRRIDPERAPDLIHGAADDWLTAAGYEATCITKNNSTGYHLLYYWSETEPNRER